MTLDTNEARALVERLKGYTPHSEFSNLEAMAKTALRAADALTAALDEIERLEKSIEATQAVTFYAQDDKGYLRRWYPPAMKGADQ
jgi:hypothetical protein